MGIADIFAEVLDLQKSYANTDTPAMKRRGILIRDDVCQSLEQILVSIDLGDWSIKGNNGSGRPAIIPFVRVFDPKFSPKPTDGFYVALLFSANGEQIYLSLNQGTNSFQGGAFVGRDPVEIEADTTLARDVLRGNSAIEANLICILDEPPIMDLAHYDGLAKDYSLGDVIHFKYLKGELPSDQQLEGDLRSLLSALKVIYDNFPNSSTDEALPVSGLSGLAGRVGWDVGRVRDVVDALSDASPQVVLTGPPGTGKTFVARNLAAHVLGVDGQVDDSRIRMVQFHPSYGYENFVEGLQPVAKPGGAFEFQNVAGTIVSLANEVVETGEARVLIIDEMNRANIPRVFGELMYLLEYRDSAISLMHTKSFTLPKDLFIIGTMNTADRSIRSIDLALRRRFDFFEVQPDVEILRSFYKAPGRTNELGEQLFSGFVKLNEELELELDRHFLIGHSFFMVDKFSRNELRRVWDQQVYPLIEEYFFASPDVAQRFQQNKYWPNMEDGA